MKQFTICLCIAVPRRRTILVLLGLVSLKAIPCSESCLRGREFMNADPIGRSPVFLITATAAILVGRVAAVPSFLGDNDRSRWATVYALVENGTYVIGHRDYDPTGTHYVDRGIITEGGWNTVDKVLRPD